MFEYTLFYRHGTGKPYTMGSYSSLESAKADLFNRISLEEERGRFYYVDNDFFENKYPLSQNGLYICIKVHTIL